MARHLLNDTDCRTGTVLEGAKLAKLNEKARTAISKLVKAAKNDEEAAAIIKREVEAIAGAGQIHHPISDTVHKALENHPKLKGKYQLRDSRCFSSTICTARARRIGW